MAATKDIADILRQRDPEKYKHIIERAELDGYHDFKYDRIPGHPEYADGLLPKMQLVQDLGVFPELNDIRDKVMAGDFDDDTPDEIDEIEIRTQLLDEDAPDAMFEMMGLKLPSYAERYTHKRNKGKN